MTPEERRDAQLRAMAAAITTEADGDRETYVNVPSDAQRLDALLAHFDKTEPAVAKAIRYGLIQPGTLSDGEPTFVIDKPEERPRHDYNMPHDIRYTQSDARACPPNCPAREFLERQGSES